MIYQQIIRYVEGRCSEREALALWTQLLTRPQLLAYLKTACWLERYMVERAGESHRL